MLLRVVVGVRRSTTSSRSWLRYLSTVPSTGDVLLIDKSGVSLGVTSSANARSTAEQNGLVLRVMNPKVQPPIVRLFEPQKLAMKEKKAVELKKKNQQVCNDVGVDRTRS